MQQMVFIADFIACPTCFGHHYAHHQELEIIIQRYYTGLCVRFAGYSSLQTGHITLSSTPYRQLENQSTKYHRQRPSVYYSRTPDDGHNGARNMLSKQ